MGPDAASVVPSVPPPVAPAIAVGEFAVRERVVATADAVVLGDPGAEPRRVLGLRGRVGERRALRVTLGLSLAMELGGRTAPLTEIPPVVVTLLVETTASDAKGIELSITVTEVETGSVADATTRVQEAATRTADRLRSTKGKLRLAADGRVLAFEFTDGAATPLTALEPELGGLVAALQGVLVAVPETEAVGDGAHWTSVRHVRRDAVRREERGAWTLAVTGPSTTLTLQSEHVGTTDEDLGTTSKVEATSGTTTANIVLGDGPLPLRATATIETKTRGEIELMHDLHRVSLRTVLNVALEDVGAAP